VILGATWLGSIGPHIHDYTARNIQFSHEGKEYTFQGQVPEATAMAHFHQLKRFCATDAIQECFALQWTDNREHTVLTSPEPHPPEVVALLQRYHVVFSIPTSLPPQRVHDHTIPLVEGATPVKARPYRYPHSQKMQIESMVDDMLRNGLIHPSKSPFSSPVILVKKKDGSWRFCTDYRALNALTIKDKFPIPTVDELLDELHRAVYFSKLELRSGYHQILVSPPDRHKTAFRTHHGHYEWLVMPFGLTNAPATFQSLMNQIFKHVAQKFVLVFFDDILVYSPSWLQHLEHLEIVLQILKEEHLFAKSSKCSFAVREIAYLGHVISVSEVAMDKEKLSAIQDWPRPTSLPLLRGFLGLTGYYRKFVRSYASIAAPLTDLTKKEAFVWNPEAEKAFELLKTALTTAPLLRLPNFSLPFVLETDASGVGIGAVLMQEGHPVAYFSQKLSSRMQKQSAYVRELFAVTQAMAKFRHYLLGHRFLIRTDQRSLKELLTQSLHTPEQQQWLPKFLGYDFEVQYKPGKDNIAADALSRCFIMSVSSPKNVWLQKIVDSIQASPHWRQIFQQASNRSTSDPHYSTSNDVLYWKHRIVVPERLRSMILTEFHDSPVGGHSGISRTMARICASFYWPNMQQDIRHHVQNCLLCQQTKHTTTSPAGLLQPLPIPNQIWEDVAMDFITGLPPSRGFCVIMVVVDRLSKFDHFIPLRPNFDSKHVADAFISHIVSLHGIPKFIVSDRDRVFVSTFWKHLWKAQGTTLAMSSAYHPQTDGQSESLNKTLEMYLRCFACDNPRVWCTLLPWAQLWYNTAWQHSLGTTPFKAVYGRDPPLITRYQVSSSDSPVVQNLLQNGTLC